MNTLYTALEQALRLMHPFAPFLTEELWQRLGRRPSEETPSITVAKYPVYQAEFEDSASEDAYELVLDSAKGVRSLIAEYRNENAIVYIQTANESAYKIASEQLAIIKSISGKNWKEISVIPHTDATPTGCAVFAVSTNAAVFLKLQGDININEEIAKVQVKMKKAAETVAKQRKLIEAPDFKEKVSAAVQEAEDKKLEEALALQGNYEKTIQQFQTMKLGK
jgi:valyl-tRNA synthetase